MSIPATRPSRIRPCCSWGAGRLLLADRDHLVASGRARLAPKSGLPAADRLRIPPKAFTSRRGIGFSTERLLLRLLPGGRVHAHRPGPGLRRHHPAQGRATADRHQLYHLNSSGSNTGGGSNSNLSIQDQEAFSRSLHGQFGLNYTDNYGPLVSLPAQYDLTAALDHGDAKGDRQNYSFHRSSTGTQASTDDYGASDHRQFSNTFTNDTTVSYTTSQNIGFPGTTTLHYETLTHYSGRSYDYDLTFDRYDTSTPTNVQKEPELAIRPHDSLIPASKRFPITAQYTLGIYDDPEAAPTVHRPACAHHARKRASRSARAWRISSQRLLRPDHRPARRVRHGRSQSADRTAGDVHHAAFGHVINVISYNESQVNGPLAEPFKSIGRARRRDETSQRRADGIQTATSTRWR